jgi:hypothetical protein
MHSAGEAQTPDGDAKMSEEPAPARPPVLRRLALAAAVVAAVAVLFAVLWGAGAYNTRGLIFIGSPEVYTRERLVNDRYDQDFWLHSQLDLLDETTALLTSLARDTVSIGGSVEIGGADPPAVGTDGGDAPAPALPDITLQMPFDQQFLIRAGVRDAIRQLILENLLDDRHDLTGNSVYGLKFDISVIAGGSTYASAFVRASVKARQLFSEEGPQSGTGKGMGTGVGAADDPDSDEIGLPRHVRQYFNSTISDIEQKTKHPLHTSYSLYNLWLADVGARLNTYIAQIYDTVEFSDFGDPTAGCGPDARGEWERRVLRAVSDVLGVSDTAIATENALSEQRRVKLPSPWRNHITVSVSEFREANCGAIPVFSTDPIWDLIYLVEGEPPGPGFMYADEVDDTTSAYISTKGYAEEDLVRDPSIFQDLAPRYKRVAAVADYVKNQTDGTAMMASPLPGSGRSASVILIPSGFFNFIESVIRTDSYTYALFPKTEVFGVLAEQSSDFEAALSGGIAGRGQGAGSVSTGSSERGYQAAPRSVGFSDASADGAVEFGWVIGGRGRLASTQKSGLALISVPAWTNELAVHVETGWVSGGGAPTITRSYDFAVPIPPDYEAFDAFVGGSRIRHEPRISNDLMASEQNLEACGDVSIIIPGFRLWRSTVVTLGGQAADRITVLPNMRGIIARFDRLFASDVPAGYEPAKLRVWTSEGVDAASTTFNIGPPRDGASTCDAGAANGSGDDDAGEVAARAGAPDR